MRLATLPFSLRALALCAFFLLAGLWFTRPLFLHLDHALPYGTTPDVQYRLDASGLQVRPADIHQVLFHQWLFADNLANGRSPFANVYEFQPLNTRELHWLGVWGFPMQLLFTLLASLSPVVALNLVVIATYPITGLVQYALLRRLAVRPSLALLGACLFTFALARRVQLACGHMNGALYFLLPLTLLLYLIAIESRSWRWSVASGLSVVLWALGEWHMFYFSGLFVPVLVLAIIAAAWRDGAPQSARSRVLLALPMLGGFVLGAAYLLWYRSQFIVGSTAEHRNWGDMAINSPPLRMLFDASKHLQQPVMFGSEVESAIALDPASLFVLALTLSVLTARRFRGRTHALHRLLLPVLLVLGALFALLSTGAHGAKIFGLYKLLHQYLPHFDTIRVPGRMIYLVYFSLAVSLPLALERVLAGAATHTPIAARWIESIVVCTLVAAPLVRAPGALLSGVLSRSELAPLRAAVGPEEPVLLWPITGAGASSSSFAEHFIVATQRRTLNGYAPNAPVTAEKMLEMLKPLNAGELPRAKHQELWALGIRQVIELKNIEFLRPTGADRKYIEELVQSLILKEVDETAAYRRFKLSPP